MDRTRETRRGRPIKVLLVAASPVQYATPQFVRYSEDARLDVTVAYCSLRGVEPALDPDFGVVVAWDVPLLQGHRWVHPPERSSAFVPGTFNPGLWDLARSGGFDVVVSYGYRSPSNWIAAVAARTSGARLVWTSDATRLEPRSDVPGSWWNTMLKRALLPLVFGMAQGVLTPSTMGERFLSSMRVKRAKVFVTPFVADNDFFERGSAASDPGAVRREWDVPTEACVALFCGKLAPWKRPLDLLEATARVPNLMAVFAGDGALRASLERRAKELEIADRTRFLGFVNQSRLPAIYGAADVLVLPSEYEPFGLVVNEAFACGTPAIATTACGASGDLVRDDETGFTYPSGDVRALAEHLRRLEADPAERDRLGAAAKRRISRWGLDENASAFASAMIEVAGRRR